MARVKRGVTPRPSTKDLDQAKGYYGRRKNTIRIAAGGREAANTPTDRKVKKRSSALCGSSASTQRFAPRD